MLFSISKNIALLDLDSDKLIQFRYRADARKPKNQDEYLILMRTLVESGPLLYKLGVTDE